VTPVVQLRVDVAAADARREFNQASRSVRDMAGALDVAQRQADQLGDELTVASARAAQATREFDAASNAADDAADEMRRLRGQVDALGNAAPQALVDQLRQAEDHLRDMEREEQRLREAMEDATHEQNRLNRAFTDGGDRVQHITRQLAEARREADRLRVAMDRANRQANNPLRGAQRGLLGFRQQINNVLSGQGGLGAAISQAWANVPVEAKAAIVGAGLAMATLLASAVGAALNALLLAAIGGAVLAGVVALAAKSSNVVQAAFADVFQPIGKQITSLAQGAEGPLVASARVFGAAWTQVSEDVRGAIADILPVIKPLAEGIAGLGVNAMPGFRDAVKASVPVLKELARDLPLIGEAASEMFASFARGGDGAVKGMRAVATIVGGTLIIIGDVVEALSKRFDQFTNNLETVTVGLSKIPGIGKAFEGAADFWQNFNNGADGAVISLTATGEAADDAALGMGRQAEATSAAARAAQQLSRNLDDLINTELGAKEASINFEAALDAITESAKENGRSLDITNAKGRANAETLLSGVRAAEAKRLADIALAGGENASAAAIDRANAAYQAQVEQIRATARAAGFTEAEINNLIGTLNRIPKSVRTTFTLEYRTVGSIPKDQRVGAGVIKGYAIGGSPPPGWAWVGEHGPELVKFAGGETVLNAMKSAQLMGASSGATASRPASAAGATASPVMNNHLTVNAPVGSTAADTGKAVIEAIKAYERTSGSGWRR